MITLEVEASDTIENVKTRKESHQTRKDYFCRQTIWRENHTFSPDAENINIPYVFL